jgi:hypothetical protein
MHHLVSSSSFLISFVFSGARAVLHRGKKLESGLESRWKSLKMPEICGRGKEEIRR